MTLPELLAELTRAARARMDKDFLLCGCARSGEVLCDAHARWVECETCGGSARIDVERLYAPWRVDEKPCPDCEGGYRKVTE